jgi:hypothetical protein
MMLTRDGARAAEDQRFRGGKVMKSLQILGIAGFAAAMTGCVPDWARENETGLLMTISGITGFAGGETSGTEGDILLSDVSTEGSVFNDDAVVTVSLFRKNPTVGATTPLEDVQLESYQVRYFRTDGHSVEGVDVPHRITGPINSILLHAPAQAAEFEADVVINVVRHTAKLEPPLLNLKGALPAITRNFLIPGQGLITTVAEITVFARQVTTGEPLSATGRLQVTFADFAD